MPKKLPKPIIDALESTGLPWSIQPKRKHNFILIDNHIVLVSPHGAHKEAGGSRHMQNSVARIKRAGRMLKETA